MKVKVERQYFNDTVFGKFFPDAHIEDTLLLIKKYSSFNKKDINEVLRQKTRIRYRQISPLRRRYFKWTVTVGRIVPCTERLFIYDGKNLISDVIQYTDNDLELMSQFWNEPLHKESVNINELLEKYRGKCLNAINSVRIEYNDNLVSSVLDRVEWVARKNYTNKNIMDEIESLMPENDGSIANAIIQKSLERLKIIINEQ